MKVKPFYMEEWFKKYRPFAKYNLADSGVRDFTLKQIFELCNKDISILENVKLDYPNSSGSIQLRQTVCKTYKEVNPENVLITTSTSEALFIYLNEILAEGDSVIVEFPAFQSLYEIPKALGCNVKFINLKAAENYKPNLSDIKKAIDSNTKLIIINNPHNPTGSVIYEEEMTEIIDFAAEKNIHILADEHYRYLPLDGKSTIPSMVDLESNISSTGSITKCFGMIGLRVGWLIAEESFINKCRITKDYLTHVLSPVSDYIATIVLENRQRILDLNIHIIRSNLKTLQNLISQHKDVLNWIPPQGGAVALINYRLNIDSNTFCEKLFQQESVFVLPASAFEQNGYFRICLGIESKIFIRAIERLDKYIRRLK